MKLLVLFSVCLALLATAHAAPSSTSKGNKPSAAIDETAEMLCNVLVQASKELIHDGSVKVNLLKDYLRQDCSKLPKTLNLEQNCKAAVDTYVTDIVEHLQKGTETDKICPLIQGREKPSLTLPLPKSLNITPNQTCVLCEFVIHLLQTFATANSSAQELASILEHICQIMPDVLRAECKGFIEAYGFDIIAILVREFDPPTVCEKVKLCPKQQNVQFLSKPNPNTCGLCDYVETYISSGFPKEKACQYFSNDNNVKQHCEVLVQLYKPGFCPQLQICHEAPVVPPTELSLQSVECSLCKYVVGYVENIIQNNKSAAAVEAALEKVCSIVPGALKDKCDKFVNTYGPIIALLLLKYNDTTQVCNALKVCNNGTERSLPSLPHLDLQSVECSLCKYVVGYVENIIQNNKSAAAVEAALEKVCSIVPGALKDKCDKFVNTYGPIIALLLLKYNDTTQVCNALKVCNNGTEIPLSRMSRFDLPTVKSVECSLCKYVVGYVENVIQNNKSAAAVEAALEKVCSIVPGALKDKCDKFVNTYGPIIALLLLKYNDTTQVCNALKVCNNGTELPLPDFAHFDLPSVKSVECSLCKYVVGYVENIIQNNKSAAAVEAALEKVCSIVPGALKDKCDKFVNTYGPIIALLLLKYNDTTQVCNALKVCNNGTETPLPDFAHFDLPSVKSVECSLCKYVVGYVENIIQNNKSAAAVEAALEKVCSIVPGALKDKCDKFVNTYGPIIALLLAKYNDTTQVCNALKVCNNGTVVLQPVTENITPRQVHKRSIAPLQAVGASPECALCKYIISYVDTVIQNNKSAAAIEAALEKVCTILPAALKDKCKKFVDSYGPILVQLLANHTTPEGVCNALKLCNNGTVVLQPVTEIISSRKVQKRSVAPHLAAGASPECALCKYIISYVDTVIQNNKSAAAIEAALEKVCTILPAALKDKCKTFVDTYGPILVHLLANHTTPEGVCNALKLCNNGTVSITPIAAPKIEGVECSLCKYVVGYIEHVVESNKTEAAVDAALEKVCTILPSDLKDKCKTFVDTYGPLLFQLLQKFGTADAVCKALKLCLKETGPASPALVFPTIDASAIKSAECALCKYIVSYVDSVIQNNKSQAAIDAALEKVCTILPAALKDKCKTFVDTYGPILAQLLVKYTTPEQVCDALKLCNNGTVVLQPVTDHISASRKVQKRSIAPLQAVGASPECALCKYIVSYVDSVVQNNKSEAAIDAALEKVCTILPAALKTKCKEFVDTYGPLLAQLLAKYATPDQVCNALKACNNGTVVLQPVTENISAPRKVQKQLVAPLLAVSASPECALCKYVISYLDSVIQNNKSEAAIEAALDQVCKILPAALQDKCKQFVIIYGPVIPQLLIHYGTPDQVCNALSLCNNGTQKAAVRSPRAVVESLKKPVGSDIECSLCKYVLNYINVLVSSNASAQEIEKALEVVCGILPSADHKACDTFVKQYGPVLAQLVAELDDPNVVCQWLSLCTKSTGQFIEIPVVKKGLKTLPCNLCQYVVNYLDVIVKANSTETDFEKALDQVCAILPGKGLQGECQTLVNLYGPAMINFLVEHADPKTVCQTLGICDK